MPQIIGHIRRVLVAMEDSEGRITWFHSTEVDSVEVRAERPLEHGIDRLGYTHTVAGAFTTTIEVQLGKFVMGVGMPDFSDRAPVPESRQISEGQRSFPAHHQRELP